jgi:hypothetical protein
VNAVTASALNEPRYVRELRRLLKVVAAVLVAVVLAIGWLVARERQPVAMPTPPANPAPVTPDAALNQEIKNLSGALEALRSKNAELEERLRVATTSRPDLTAIEGRLMALERASTALTNSIDSVSRDMRTVDERIARAVAARGGALAVDLNTDESVYIGPSRGTPLVAVNGVGSSGITLSIDDSGIPQIDMRDARGTPQLTLGRANDGRWCLFANGKQLCGN